MRKADRLVISCEHASSRVPARYRRLFRGWERLLDSHRGWDPGSLDLARELAQRYGAPLIASTVTRLLIDCNRSIDHAGLFSKPIRQLDQKERGAIVEQYYAHHRGRLETSVDGFVTAGHRVLHLAVHSFTPELRGVVRRCDVGLLYDPRRFWEREIVQRWRSALREIDPRLRVWLNYPYRGWSDGLTTTLRRKLPRDRYAGIELEVNQRIVLRAPLRWRRLKATIGNSLASVIRVPRGAQE